MSDDPAAAIHRHPRFAWREGMKDQRGLRVVDLDLWDGASPPDLLDPATAGVILHMADDTRALTDVVRQGSEWIVAVDLPDEGLSGWAADTLGEAAAYALLAAWAAGDTA